MMHNKEHVDTRVYWTVGVTTALYCYFAPPLLDAWFGWLNRRLRYALGACALLLTLHGYFLPKTRSARGRFVATLIMTILYITSYATYHASEKSYREMVRDIWPTWLHMIVWITLTLSHCMYAYGHYDRQKPAVTRYGPSKPLGDWVSKQVRLHARLVKAIEQNEVGELKDGDVVVMDDRGRVAAARSFTAALRILGLGDDVHPGQVATVLYPLYLNDANAMADNNEQKIETLIAVRVQEPKPVAAAAAAAVVHPKRRAMRPLDKGILPIVAKQYYGYSAPCLFDDKRIKLKCKLYFNGLVANVVALVDTGAPRSMVRFDTAKMLEAIHDKTVEGALMSVVMQLEIQPGVAKAASLVIAWDGKGYSAHMYGILKNNDVKAMHVLLGIDFLRMCSLVTCGETAQLFLLNEYYVGK